MNEIQNILLDCKIKKISKWRIKKQLDVSWHSVYMWEKGVYQPRLDKLNKLKEFLKAVTPI